MGLFPGRQVRLRSNVVGTVKRKFTDIDETPLESSNLD